MSDLLPTVVLNHDVVGLVSRLNRVLIEMHKSASSSISEMTSADVERLKTYLGAVKAKTDWIVAQPELDLPETAPRQHPLPAYPALSKVENESINDVLLMVELARDELVFSQSAKRPAGLVKFDEQRLRALVDKLEKFLTDFVEKVTPLDLPESSPSQPSSGPGALTLN